VQKQHFQPLPEKLSVIAAVILLAYALTPFMQITPQQLKFNILGIVISFQLDFTLLISFIAAGLATAGIDWLIRDHPQLSHDEAYSHYLLPALTAWVIGIPLGFLQVSAEWWVVFCLGIVLLLSVLMAEYISVDITDTRYPPALMVLEAVSFGLFLTVSIVARAAELRLYLILLTIVPIFGLLCLRLFHLRTGGKWNIEWAAGITFIIAQLVVGLYYWPISPIRFGLILLGAGYALINFAAIYEPGQTLQNKLLVTLIMLGLFLFLAIILG
jgi:hypothetical protein